MSEQPPLNIDPVTGEIVDEEDVPFEVEPEDDGDDAGGQLVAVDGELVSVVGGIGSAEALARVEEYATALTDFVKDHELTLEMEDGSHYLLSPAWEALGQLTGYFALIEWVNPIQNGWEARAIVHKPTLHDGDDLLAYTARQAICTRSEFGKERKPDHELHAMAQTRACRNALRATLSIIPNTAGFDSTPMEERARTPRQNSMMHALFTRLDRLQPRSGGWKKHVQDQTMRRFGKTTSGLNRTQANAVIHWAQGKADELAAVPKKDRPSFDEPTDAERAEAEGIAF